MTEFAVTAIGRDRPGIVAAVTEVLYDLGCNLADCSMSLLRSQFAMILLVEAPEGVSGKRLEEALGEPVARLGLVTTVREVAHAAPAEPARPHVISLYGADRPGIVYRISRTLADRGVNITDLTSHVTGGNVYTMALDVDLPPSLDPAALEAALGEVARELDVHLTFRPSEAAEL